MVTKEESEKYYLAIGRFVCAFSNLELELKADLTRILGLTSADGRRVLVHDFAMICTVAESVFSNREGDESSAELKKLIKGCRALNNHRIKIVHGFWRIGEEGRSEVGYLSRNTLKIEPHYRNHEEITKLADEAERLADALGGWFEDFVIRTQRSFKGHEG